MTEHPQKWLRHLLVRLNDIPRCSFIRPKLRASHTERLVLGHAHLLLRTFLRRIAGVLA